MGGKRFGDSGRKVTKSLDGKHVKDLGRDVAELIDSLIRPDTNEAHTEEVQEATKAQEVLSGMMEIFQKSKKPTSTRVEESGKDFMIPLFIESVIKEAQNEVIKEKNRF